MLTYLPPYLLTYLPTYLPTCQLTYLLAYWLTGLLTYLLSYLLVGEEMVEEAAPTMGGEDFAYLLERVPGAMVFPN